MHNFGKKKKTLVEYMYSFFSNKPNFNVIIIYTVLTWMMNDLLNPSFFSSVFFILQVYFSLNTFILYCILFSSNSCAFSWLSLLSILHAWPGANAIRVQAGANLIQTNENTVLVFFNLKQQITKWKETTQKEDSKLLLKEHLEFTNDTACWEKP